MSNSTTEYWSIGDLEGNNQVSLHQWGWAVTTVGGSRYDLPTRRGTDITLAYRPGQTHRRKVPDTRQISLVMFMVGWDPATGDAPEDMRLQWNNNWDTLRRLVYRHAMLADQRVRLYRRWWLSSPDFPTTGDADTIVRGDIGVPPAGNRLIPAYINAEMTGNMSPTMTGRFRSDFQMDFTCADPYFYGNIVQFTMDPGDTKRVWNDGHDVAGPGYLLIDCYGPLSNFTITNVSTKPNHYMKFTGTIPAGKQVQIQVNRFTAYTVVPEGTVTQNWVGNITSYGARWWLCLLPGANKLTFTGTGSGNIKITYRPPYV